MLKIFIKLRKKLFLQPKWRILRVYTKTISKKKLVELRDMLFDQQIITTDEIEKANILGKIEILDKLLQ